MFEVDLSKYIHLGTDHLTCMGAGGGRGEGGGGLRLISKKIF